jgi:hypothetical protein
MLTPTVTEPGDRARRAYRREIRSALKIGVHATDVAAVVCAFAGERPEPEELRVALEQYVPALMLVDASDEEYRR